METFSALLAICSENSPVPGEFPTQRPVTRSFDVFFDLRLNKRLSKQWWGWWSETLLHPLWRHRNVHHIACPWAIIFLGIWSEFLIDSLTGSRTFDTHLGRDIVLMTTILPYGSKHNIVQSPTNSLFSMPMSQRYIQYSRNLDMFLLLSIISNKVWWITHYLHIEADTKLPPFSRRHFQIHFLKWSYVNLD